MRLKNSEAEALTSVIERHVGSARFELYLYGSRIDPQKKGGDIDLLLRVSSADLVLLRDRKGLIKSDLSVSVGDQRVDLLLSTIDRTADDVFVREVAKEARLIGSKPAKS